MARGTALLLNPKAVALYLAGQWEAKGRPPPILRVEGSHSQVRVFDPLDGRRELASGQNAGDSQNDEDGNELEGVGTSGAVQYADWGKGYGLALYAGLALFASTHGIWSSDSGRSREAARLWAKMKRHGLAYHQDGGEQQKDTNWCYETQGDEEIDDFNNTSRTATVQSGQEVCGDVTVEYETPDFDYLYKDTVADSGLVLLDGSSDYAEGVREAISADAIPPDLFAVMPFRRPQEFKIVLDALQRVSGAERALRRLTTRPDLIDVSGQLRIATPHSRRVTDQGDYRLALTRGIRTEEFEPTDPGQQPLFGLGGGRRRKPSRGVSGLGSFGNPPRPTSISADLRRYLEKWSDITEE